MYNGLQQLRFYAAFLVVVSHSIISVIFTLGEQLPYWVAWLSGVGVVGVEIFFVISGFIMAQSVRMLAPGELTGFRSGIGFLLKRLRRIWPLYAILTAVAAILVKSNFASFIASILFVSQPIAANLPIIAYGGTLEYEMFFYLVISIVIILPIRGKMWVSSLILLAFVGFGVVSSSVVDFVIGFLAYFVVTKVKENRKLGIIAIFLGAGGLLVGWLLSDNGWKHPGWLFYGIATGVMIVGITISKIGNQPRLLVELGNASFSIYLAQWFCWFGIGWVFSHDLIPRWITPDLFILLSIPLVIAFGYLCYLFLERPIDKRLRVIGNQW